MFAQYLKYALIENSFNLNAINFNRNGFGKTYFVRFTFCEHPLLSPVYNFHRFMESYINIKLNTCGSFNSLKGSPFRQNENCDLKIQL